MDLAIAAAVRHREPEWGAEIDGFLRRTQDEITAILRAYGVPLLDLEPPPAGSDLPTSGTAQRRRARWSPNRRFQRSLSAVASLTVWVSFITSRPRITAGRALIASRQRLRWG